MRFFTSWVVGVAVSFATTAALAQTAAPVDSALPTGAQPALPAPVTQPLPANRWTALQIRQAFELADANSDGQLSRAEAQHLPIMPRSFEDTDTNKDGVLVLGEYESSFH